MWGCHVRGGGSQIRGGGTEIPRDPPNLTPGGNQSTHGGVRVGLHSVMFSLFYRQDLPQAALPALFLFTSRFGFFSPRHV